MWSHLAETRLADYAIGTSSLAALVCVGATALAVPPAWLLSRYRFPGAGVLSWAMLLPLAVPGYIAAYAYTDLCAAEGPLHRVMDSLGAGDDLAWLIPDMRTLGGAALVLASTLFPYVYFAARVAFREQPASAIESGRVLGAGPLATALRVELPLATPAIAAGLLLVLMETVADFGTADYCAVDTFATGIYRTWLGLGSEVGAAQLSTVLVAPLVGVVVLESWLRRRRRSSDTTCRSMGDRRVALGMPAGLCATAVCLGPLVLGFVIPVVHLAVLSLSDNAEAGRPWIAAAAWNTLRVAAIAAAAAVVFSIVLVAASRFASGRATRLLLACTRFGYAVPGPVIAIGVIAAVSGVSRALHAADLAKLGSVFVIGSLVTLVLGYQTRFLGVALAYTRAAFERIDPRTDDATRTLGVGSLGLLTRVHLPLARGGIVVGFVVLFTDVAKELPITLMLRPFDFETLAVRAYKLASDERLGEAAGACLAMIGVGIVPAAILGLV
ncbi:MAG: iron ABC transporter permease, partial [Planctomycetota bacterium]